MNYAPIIIFAYNRADKLKNLLNSLEKNSSINKMDLYIFVDIPDKKNTRDVSFNKEVLDFLEDYKIRSNNFNKMTIEIAEKHKGLANSIISGVSKIIKKYNKVIVLEDDLIVSSDFLDYMQRGLKFYENDKRIWSITAHCPRLKFLDKYEKDVFLAPRIESLGWGTWKDRWNKTDWNVSTYEKFKKDIIGKWIFNLGGNDLTKMLQNQMLDEKYDSWAIRWCYQEFLERKFTVYPKESRVIHCGNDNRSTHGSYFSTQKLKKNYKKCKFVFLKPNLKIIWSFRKANSVSFIERFKNR